MKKKKEKVIYVDDGRTIANMNIEGMPWYNPAKNVGNLPEGKVLGGGFEASGSSADSGVPKYNPNFKETMSILGGVLKAAMLIALIFIGVFFIFILFCYFIWFR